MQCWFNSNVENLWYFFQDSSMNEKLNKNSIYLKYNFCNNITKYIIIVLNIYFSPRQNYFYFVHLTFSSFTFKEFINNTKK